MNSAQLYTEFMKLGFLGFGGGYMMIPLFFSELVGRLGWIDHGTMLAILAMAQTIPGPFAVNTAALVGFHLGSPLYALIAACGIVTPALPAAFLSEAYIKPRLNHPAFRGLLAGLGAAVVGIICGAGLSLGEKAVTDLITAAIALLAFYLFYNRRKNPAISMLVASGAGFLAIILLK